MNPHSAKALAWCAGILVALALIVMSPVAAFAMVALAAFCAAIPSVFAHKRTRVISVVLLMVSMALVATFYPAFQRDREAYARRAKERAARPQVTAPTDQSVNKKPDHQP